MKTTIKLCLFTFSLLLVGNIYSQNPLSIGVKAGLNLSDFAGNLENTAIKPGYNAGITVDYRMSRNIFLLSGIEVSTKGAKDKKTFENDDTTTKGSYNPTYIQIPLHVGYKVFAMDDMSIIAHAGPYFAYGIGGKQTVTTQTNGESKEYKTNMFGEFGLLKRFDFGLGVGAGVEYKMIGINFGYDLGITNGSDDIKLVSMEGMTDLKVKNNTAHVSLTYRFQL